MPLFSKLKLQYVRPSVHVAALANVGGTLAMASAKAESLPFSRLRGLDPRQGWVWYWSGGRYTSRCIKLLYLVDPNGL